MVDFSIKINYFITIKMITFDYQARHKMTYDQLVTMEAVVKEGSFKAASKVLHKTQPSLSAAIKKLEEEFQIQIFSRENYRPELTEEGRVFYHRALPALETFRELETFGRELSMGAETEISVSLDAILPMEKINPVIESFFDPKTSVSLNLTIDILEGLTERILEHEADFAIGSYIEPHDEIEAVRLFDTQMIPVISPKLLNETEGQLRKLKKFPQIIVRSSSKKSSQKIVGSLPGAKRWFTSDMMMKEKLIMDGLGWGRLPLHQVEEKTKKGLLIEIEGLQEVQRVSVPLYLLKSKTKNLGPNARKLWQYLLEACQK